MLSSHAISESTAMWSVSEDGVVRNRSRNIERACMPNERTCLHTHTRGRAFMLQLDVRVRRAYGAPVALEAPIGPPGPRATGVLGPWGWVRGLQGPVGPLGLRRGFLGALFNSHDLFFNRRYKAHPRTYTCSRRHTNKYQQTHTQRVLQASKTRRGPEARKHAQGLGLGAQRGVGGDAECLGEAPNTLILWQANARHDLLQPAECIGREEVLHV
jgi:hypothetical protein